MKLGFVDGCFFVAAFTLWLLLLPLHGLHIS
jgi:hypothetical protein